jgi:flagellin
VASGSRLGAADFNHDGIDDVIIGGGVNSSIYLNQGGGSFTLSQTISGFSTFTDRFKFADINQDGEIDIVASSGGGPKVVLGSSSGVFGSVISQTALTSGLALGDFNGDGVPDFATGDDSSGGIDIGISNTTQSTLLSRINLLSRQNALDSLSIIDAALARVNKQNGAVGAHLSRLEIAMANLGASSLNFDSARSRIVDADVASESAQLVRSTILQQAASSVLAQANQAPALALVLLRS